MTALESLQGGRYLSVTEPPFRRHGLGYVYEPAKTPYRFTVDYLSRSGDELRATVFTDRKGEDGLWKRVHRGKMLLEGSNSKRDYSKQCQEIHDDEASGKFWRLLVEDVCCRVLDAEEQGEPFVMVGKGPRVTPPQAIIEPVVKAGVDTILFGPPGTGKGYLVIYFAVLGTLGLSLAGLKVKKSNWLYLDWEDSEAEMAQRIQEVCAGLKVDPIEIHRRNMKGKSLHGQVHQIARYVNEQHIDVVIVDSVEKAIGSAGEGQSYEDKAKRLFEATDHLRPCAVLFIDHESWQQKSSDNKAVGKAFGSYMKMAWVRAAWQARKEQAFGAKVSSVALYHAKSNRGAQLEPLLFELDFKDEGAVKIRRGDIQTTEELAKVLPLADRIDHCLSEGSKAVQVIATEIGESEASVRTILNRHKDRRFVKLDDGRWGKMLRSDPGRPPLRLVDDEMDDIPF